MKEQKTGLAQIIFVVFLLILTLPLFYLLFTKVLLPMTWKEETFEKKDSVSVLPYEYRQQEKGMREGASVIESQIPGMLLEQDLRREKALGLLG